jgi:hypothetical protein
MCAGCRLTGVGEEPVRCEVLRSHEPVCHADAGEAVAGGLSAGGVACRFFVSTSVLRCCLQRSSMVRNSTNPTWDANKDTYSLAVSLEQAVSKSVQLCVWDNVRQWRDGFAGLHTADAETASSC